MSKNKTKQVKNNQEIVKQETTNKKPINKKNTSKPKKVDSHKKSFWENASELTKLIVVFLIIVGIFIVFYFITDLIKSKGSSQTNKDDSIAVIQYDEILVGEILNQNKDNYYVLATVKDDPNVSLYTPYIESYKTLQDALKFYTVNLSSVFNNRFLTDESNFDIEKIKDIKFKQTTLLKIENKQIVEYYEGQNDIIEFLKELR